MDDNTQMLHEYMLKQAVPETMVQLVRCKCKKSCDTKRCSCRKANLNCTDACLCNEDDQCSNIQVTEYVGDNDYDESDIF